MRKNQVSLLAVFFLVVFTACKKSDSNSTSTARTVQNLSGSYKITAISVYTSGITLDEFANLEDCQKDNIITLNTDLTLLYKDAGTVCVPLGDASGTWSLASNSDSLTVNGIPTFPSGITGFIQTWDGKTLVLVGPITISNIPAQATITLYKQ